MSYKYYLSGSPTTFDSPGNQILDGFQAQLNAYFNVSPTLYTIQEELIPGTKVFTKTNARVTRAIDSETGKNLGDDFKRILFKELSHPTGLGYLYYFDNNYWMGVNTEIYKNFAQSVTVRRINNKLRWIDDEGIIYEEFAILDYEITLSGDNVGYSTNLVFPKGSLKVFAQLNARTKTIQSNQRFLFGPVSNRRAFRIYGDGIRNFLNQEYADDESNPILEIYMGGNAVADPNVDNITLGIADYYRRISSASAVGTVVVSPNEFNILESASQVYAVNVYSGSAPTSASFIFSISGSTVPVANYTFATIDGNNFSIINNEKYLDASLNVLATSTSASRLIGINLRGEW